MSSPIMTLGDLRALLKANENAPDDIPIRIGVPHSFVCGDEHYPNREGQEHDPTEYTLVNACAANLVGNSEEGHCCEEYIPPDEREVDEGEWDFAIEINIRPEEAHDQLYDTGCDFKTAD